MPGALDNLLVVDFSRVLAGPFATMMLGDLGAEVVKIERPGTGDETRSWSPPADSAGESTYFQAVNRNKSSVVLDLTDPGDRDRALGWCRRADVVVENFRPGVMDRLGLSYQGLSAGNPRLVYCSITAFGPGKGAGLPGYDLLVQALGGLMSITGEPAGAPEKVGVALVDVLAGLFSCLGILAALEHRHRTGRGQRVEVDLLSSLLAGLVNQAAAFTVAGVVPGRLGNAHPSIAPYEVLPTKDGDLVLAVGNDRQFAALCATLGRPDLGEDRRFATNAARVANRLELRRLLDAALAGDAAEAHAGRLLAAGVPAGVVNDVGAAFTLAERLGLDPVVALAREDGSTVRLPRNPVRLSETPPSYRLAPPRMPAAVLGEPGEPGEPGAR